MSYLSRIAESYAQVALSRDELAFYARHILLPGVGLDGQRKLKAARVLLVGAGGLGCPVLQALAGAGVGQLTVIDGDQVALSNLSRQWLHRYDGIGRNKAESACAQVAAFNPLVELRAIPERLDAANAWTLIEACDVVVDATDDLKVRYLIDEACTELDRPWVHAALYRDAAQMTVFWGRCGSSFHRLYPEPSSAPTCAGAGMLGASASVVANWQALEVIKLITGEGPPKIGELVSIDTKQLRIQSFRLPGVAAPSTLPAKDKSPSKHGLSAIQLKQAQSIHQPMVLVDVRSASEYAEGSLEDAINVSAETILESGLPDDIKTASQIILICAEGTVSALLADALQAQGIRQVAFLDGGLAGMQSDSCDLKS